MRNTNGAIKAVNKWQSDYTDWFRNRSQAIPDFKYDSAYLDADSKIAKVKKGLSEQKARLQSELANKVTWDLIDKERAKGRVK
jgi:hypothetical protein